MTRRERASIIIRVMITMIMMISLFNVLNYIDRHEEKRGVVVNISLEMVLKLEKVLL